MREGRAGRVRGGCGRRDEGDRERQQDANVDYDRIAREIIAETIATDEAEDEQHGDARGDELPLELATEAGRREWLARELARDQAEDEPGESAVIDLTAGFDAERIGPNGRRGWLREAHRQLEQQRWLTAEPVPRSRADRLRLAAGCLEDELHAECRGNRAYEAMREQRRRHDKRRLGGPTKPYTPPSIPAGEVNVTDPDSRRMKGNRRYIQGDNAQAVVNEQQIAIAAEITTAAGDFSQLGPMIETALGELQHAGVTDKPSVVVADAQYWNEQHMDTVIAGHGLPVLIPPDGGKRDGERPGWTGGRFSFMRRVLSTELGQELYGKRQASIEPVFGHTKHNRQIYRFNYRGRRAVRTEWRLVLMSHTSSTATNSLPPGPDDQHGNQRPPPRERQIHANAAPPELKTHKTFARHPPRKASSGRSILDRRYGVHSQPAVWFEIAGWAWFEPGKPEAAERSP